MRASDLLPDRYNAAERFVGRHVREGRGERLALVSDQGELTYAQLDVLVRRAAGAFLASGLHRGDRVALLLPDSLLLSTCFCGALAAGLVPVPLNPQLALHDHQRILLDCDARLAIADAAMVDAAGLAADARQVWTDRDATEALGEGPAAPAYAAAHRDGIAFMLYLSGTTGEPKGVVHLQHDM